MKDETKQNQSKPQDEKIFKIFLNKENIYLIPLNLDLYFIAQNHAALNIIRFISYSLFACVYIGIRLAEYFLNLLFF